MAIRLNFFDGMAFGFGSMLWIDDAPQMAAYVVASLVLAGVIFDKLLDVESDDE